MAKGEPFPRSPAGTECSGSAAERGRERRPLNVGPRGRRAAAGSRGGFSSARRLGRGDLRGLRKDEERGPSAFPHPAGLGGRGAGAAARPSPCPAELPSRRPPLGGFAITSDSSLRSKFGSSLCVYTGAELGARGAASRCRGGRGHTHVTSLARTGPRDTRRCPPLQKNPQNPAGIWLPREGSHTYRGRGVGVLTAPGVPGREGDMLRLGVTVTRLALGASARRKRA